MVNYEQAKIYQITCEKTGNIYIGSTTKKLICQRLAEHVSQYKYYMKGKETPYITSFEIIKENAYSISLIENYPCKSRNELTARETYFIRTLPCVNKSGKFTPEYRKQLAIKLLEERTIYWDNIKEENLKLEKQKIKEKLLEPYFIECSKFRKIDIY